MTLPALATGSRILALGVVMLGLGGCSKPEPIELVAVHGCGLDQEFSGLRVRVLGDFPIAVGTEILLGPGERGTIPSLPADATGVAAEGLFGTTVTAIGRSYGIDPELARGRIPGIDAEVSILPVYFAAPDSLCPLDSQPSARTEVAAAAGPAGEVLLAGGVDEDQALLDELVHVDLFTGEIRTLKDSLPSPRRGASVHAIGSRRFVVLGGAEPGEVVAERIVVDASGQGSTSASSWVIGDATINVAHHGSATAGDGRVLIVGGCDQADSAGACLPDRARASSFWYLPDDPSSSVVLPDLEVPRFAAHAVVGADDVAFVAGGFGADGLGLTSVERLAPGDGWTIVHSLADDRPIAGLALLDGGLLLLADRLGAIHWWSEAGSGTLDPTSRAPALAPVTGERPLLALPGERVLVDGWLFAPATAAVDPAVERVALDLDDRSGAIAIPLADGTALLVGGRRSQPPEPIATPTLLRLRPELDGADEWIPDLAGPQTDAFVSNAPGRATVIVGGLQLDAVDGPGDALAPVRAHVRGFRSGALRLEFSFEVDPGAVAQLTLGHGATSLIGVALLATGVEVRRRDPSGEIESLDCSLAGVEPGTTVILELSDDARQLRLSGAELLAECALDWPSSAGVAVGFGVSGTGSARFFGLRLARR
ncbi:MAG TPA: hypothetical protein VK034_22770 [Enhygromyxa sp.]|nr:hypothetical protein [Enhygromyxa sp.]